ncbi:Ger(x)C family spore germination protein [Paenibacillus elgii]|uniref:Ger(x)C family spore germination protein n=1 Tax=Paenibacillus elgii TaxID=189691 RepID=UPI00203D8C91|nr:Ger(x)C family spore germination protein [Paenibacillus elgii]MCM3267908.1 Ger(x)C family spore germination protein [Paenibacillus elgii]
MKRNVSVVCVLCLLLVLTTGCWSRRELNELAIVTGIGIDKLDNQYLLSLQMLNMGQAGSEAPGGGGGSSLPVTTQYIKADSVFEGIRRLTTKLPRKLYFSHIRVLVFGETLAQEGLRDILDLFVRDHEIRPDFFLVVTKGVEAREVMSQIVPIEQSPATALLKNLEISEKNWAPTVAITLDDFITDLMKVGKEGVMTGLQLNGDPHKGQTDANLKTVHPRSNFRFSSIGVFKNDKLVGWLNEDEGRGFSYITNRVNASVFEVPCDSGGKAAVEVLRSSTHLTGRAPGGEPVITVGIAMEGNIGELSCREDLSKPETIYAFERRAEQVIEGFIHKAVRKGRQSSSSDIFGFGEAIHRYDPRNWNRLKNDWDRHFMSAKVDTRIDIKLRRTGKVGQSFVDKMK